MLEVDKDETKMEDVFKSAESLPAPPQPELVSQSMLSMVLQCLQVSLGYFNLKFI